MSAPAGAKAAQTSRPGLQRNKLSKKMDERLWDWVQVQDRHTVEQFGIGIVGVGALFFAYTQTGFYALKILIALIGLGASLVLWMHMHGARTEKVAVFDILKENDEEFKKVWGRAMAWRTQGLLNRTLYFSVTRTMVHFMALLSWAWTMIILYRVSILLGWPTTDDLTRLWLIFTASLPILGMVLARAIEQRETDRRKNQNRDPAPVTNDKNA